MIALESNRFAGDSDLTSVRNGSLRLGAPGTSPIPAPVLSKGPAIKKVQQALMDIGYSLPNFGADGDFGGETGAAVVLLKKKFHLVPGDPVIGPKTINVLDKKMVALELERPAPVPITSSPPPPAPVFDPFGRTSAGLARVPAALAITAAFGAKGTGSYWLHLQRSEVAYDIADRISSPDHVQQGTLGLCTIAAFVNIWAQDAPDAYAAFATALFDNGAAYLAPNQAGGGLRIKAGTALLAADYPAIANLMMKDGKFAPCAADWMVMSAIRDSTNNVPYFTGNPDRWLDRRLDGSDKDGSELRSWLSNAGAWATIIDSSASLQDAKLLDPTRSRCILLIYPRMLNNDPWYSYIFSDYHNVVLRSPITETSDGFVTLRVWTYAQLKQVKVTKEKFEDTYSGATVAFF